MPIKSKILYPVRLLLKPDIFHLTDKHEPYKHEINKNLRDIQIWLAGCLASSPVEQNPGAENKKIIRIQKDIFGPGIQIHKTTNATFRVYVSRFRKNSNDFIRKYLATDPSALKTYQHSTIQYWWKDLIGLGYDPIPNRHFTNTIHNGIFSEDFIKKIEHAYGYLSLDDKEHLRWGRLGVLPFPTIKRYLTKNDFLSKGQRDLELSSPNWCMVKDIVLEHDYGISEFDQAGYKPCEITGLPGYNNFGQSLVIDIMDTYRDIDSDIRFRNKFNIPKAFQKEIIKIDQYSCVCSYECKSHLHNREGIGYDASVFQSVLLPNISPQLRDKAIKSAQNTAISVEHLIPRRIAMRYRYPRIHTFANCIASCIDCNSKTFGQKDIMDKLVLFEKYNWRRKRDNAGVKQISYEIIKEHSDNSDIRQYLSKQLKRWL